MCWGRLRRPICRGLSSASWRCPETSAGPAVPRQRVLLAVQARQLRALTRCCPYTWPPILPPHLQNLGATSLLEMEVSQHTSFSPRSQTLQACWPPRPHQTHTQIRSLQQLRHRSGGTSLQQRVRFLSLSRRVALTVFHTLSVVVCYNDL